MRLKTTILLFVPLLFVSLAGCNKENSETIVKPRLTYGTEIQQTVDSIKELNNIELFNKTHNEEETFLLATYQGSYSEDCLCWSTFKAVIANYMTKAKEIVYIYNAQVQDETLKDLNIEKSEDSAPYLYIFKGKEKLATFYYHNKNDKAIFEDRKAETMKERVHQIVDRPLLYYVLPEFIQHNEIKYHSSMTILFVRSGCSDCQYVLPNVIIPYINSHKLEIGIRIVDLQDVYETSKKEDATEQEKALYQETKDMCNLSESSSLKYGYQQGVVPTIQYYSEGSLDDAGVFFNDEIAQKEDGTYYIKDSFYTEERLTSLKYADKGENNILKGKTLSTEDAILTSSGNAFWAQEKAAQYHTPLLEAFLDYYCR